MKRPSFQFYPGDWSANPNLKRCSFAERGVWLEIMCLMHDQPDYGILRWPLKDVAQAVGCKLSEIQALIRKGVLKGDDKSLTEEFIYTPRSGRKDGEPVTLVAAQEGPIWYSSRMVKDEYIRTIRGESSRFGDTNGEALKPTPKASPKPPFGDGSSSSSSSSSSISQDLTATHLDKSNQQEPSPRAALANGKNPTPEGEMAVALRDLGVTVTSQNPLLLGWIKSGITVQQATDATALARMRKPHPEPIAPGYLDRILREPQRTPALSVVPAKAPIKYRTADEIEAEERARGDWNAQR